MLPTLCFADFENKSEFLRCRYFVFYNKRTDGIFSIRFFIAHQTNFHLKIFSMSIAGDLKFPMQLTRLNRLATSGLCVRRVDEIFYELPSPYPSKIFKKNHACSLHFASVIVVSRAAFYRTIFAQWWSQLNYHTILMRKPGIKRRAQFSYFKYNTCPARFHQSPPPIRV